MKGNMTFRGKKCVLWLLSTLSNALKRSNKLFLTCAPISELPSGIGTMVAIFFVLSLQRAHAELYSDICPLCFFFFFFVFFIISRRIWIDYYLILVNRNSVQYIFWKRTISNAILDGRHQEGERAILHGSDYFS